MTVNASIRHASFTGLLTLFLCGCGTSPIPNYYLLTANAHRSAGASSNLIIGVGPIEVAEFLERPQVAIHGGTNRLEIDELNRWAEPLESALLRVMALNLAALLGTEKITVFPWRRDDQPNLAVRIAIMALDHRTGQAVLGVRWVLVDINSEQVIHQALERYEQPASSEPALLAAAYSDLLAVLAADIVRHIHSSTTASDANALVSDDSS